MKLRLAAIIGGRRTPLQGLLWLAGAMAVTTALNGALIGWFPGVPPFLTYFPVITLVALLLGSRWGATGLIAAAAISDYFFVKPLSSWSLSASDLVAMLLFTIGGAIIIVAAAMLRGTSRQLEAVSAQQLELNIELRHRVNNTLTVVQALAMQTARASPTANDFYEVYSQRLDALRAANEILSSTDRAHCDLPSLAVGGLQGFLPNAAISFSGPPLILRAKSAVPLTLALHELATNATKYGALSIPKGRVSLGWELEAQRLVLRWIESAGPLVSEPIRKGFGSRLLAPQEGLDGVSIEYLPEGFRCTITINGARPA